MSDWTSQQIQLHRELLEKTHSLKSWRQVAEHCFDDCEFHDPASPAEVAEAEAKLGVALPEQLKAFYLQSNGLFANYGANLIMSIQDCLAENHTMRSSPDFRELYMPFDHLLIFGGAGNGDLFFFPVMIDGSLGNENVFIWDHETDSRQWFAGGLKDFLARYAVNLEA